eukprot:jgi/Tetstr1/461026/TSEL_006176.t1
MPPRPVPEDALVDDAPGGATAASIAELEKRLTVQAEALEKRLAEQFEAATAALLARLAPPVQSPPPKGTQPAIPAGAPAPEDGEQGAQEPLPAELNALDTELEYVDFAYFGQVPPSGLEPPPRDGDEPRLWILTGDTEWEKRLTAQAEALEKRRAVQFEAATAALLARLAPPVQPPPPKGPQPAIPAGAPAPEGGEQGAQEPLPAEMDALDTELEYVDFAYFGQVPPSGLEPPPRDGDETRLWILTDDTAARGLAEQRGLTAYDKVFPFTVCKGRRGGGQPSSQDAYAAFRPGRAAAREVRRSPAIPRARASGAADRSTVDRLDARLGLSLDSRMQRIEEADHELECESESESGTGRIVEDVRQALFRGHAINSHIHVHPKQPSAEDAFGSALADILNNCAERKQYDEAGKKHLLEAGSGMGTCFKNAPVDGPSQALTSRGLESTLNVALAAQDNVVLSGIFDECRPRDSTQTGIPYPLKKTPRGWAGGIIKHNINAVKRTAATQAFPSDINVDEGSSPEPPAKKAKQPAKPAAGVPARSRGGDGARAGGGAFGSRAGRQAAVATLPPRLASSRPTAVAVPAEAGCQ